MTPRQADKIIKAGKPVQFTEKGYDRVHTLLFVERTRWDIKGANGELFDRGDLTLTEGAI